MRGPAGRVARPKPPRKPLRQRSLSRVCSPCRHPPQLGARCPADRGHRPRPQPPCAAGSPRTPRPPESAPVRNRKPGLARSPAPAGTLRMMPRRLDAPSPRGRARSRCAGRLERNGWGTSGMHLPRRSPSRRTGAPAPSPKKPRAPSGHARRWRRLGPRTAPAPRRRRGPTSVPAAAAPMGRTPIPPSKSTPGPSRPEPRPATPARTRRPLPSRDPAPQ